MIEKSERISKDMKSQIELNSSKIFESVLNTNGLLKNFTVKFMALK